MKQSELCLPKPIDGKASIYTVKAVLRAAAVLRSFNSLGEIQDLRTVTKRSLQSKATAYRLLETLVQARLLERVGQQGYRCLVDVTPGRRWRIGYAAQSNVVAFTEAFTESLVAAASRVHVDLIVLNDQRSRTIALRNAEKFIEQRVDLVIGSQIYQSIAPQIAGRYSEAQIPFIAVDIPHPGAFYFGADNYKAGRLAGRYLATWCIKHWKGQPGSVCMVGANVSGPYINARLDGMRDAMIETLPDLRTLPWSQLDAGGTFEKAHDEVRKHIRTRKLQHVLIGCVNDVTALGALQAFRDFGVEEECAIAGQDGCIEAREELRKASTRLVCTVAYYPEKYGEGLVQFAMDILSNKNVPPAILTRHELLTPENVGKAYPNDSWIKSAGRTNI